MLSRRSFLFGTGAAAFLAACGGDDDGSAPATPEPGPSTTTAPAAGGLVLGEAFDRNGLLVAGIEQRAPFLLFESTGGLVPPADAPAELVFDVGAASPITVARHGDDVERPYYPLVHTFAEPGVVTVRTTVDGAPLESAVTINEPGAVTVPQVGDAMPSAPTPTVADPLGVQTICTRQPACPLHEVSLADALGAGRPVAVLISTPAYCQVAICGPVLDLLVASAPEHPDLALIHIEVYPNGEPSAETLSPLVTETFRLAYEPVLFVADAAGRVSARLDNIYDGTELERALRSATA